MSKVWGFKEQIAVGDEGQRLFLKNYHTPITEYVPHAADFQVVATGALVELKTDTYPMATTPNFFIERWSDIGSKKPGSVWQSVEKGVTIFCYMFIQDRTYFEFTDLPALIARLDDITAGSYLMAIRNKGWTTGGYRVKRESLRDLYKEYKI